MKTKFKFTVLRITLYKRVKLLDCLNIRKRQRGKMFENTTNKRTETQQRVHNEYTQVEITQTYPQLHD